MNHKIQRKWLAALRSEKIEQCYDMMYDGDKKCALGVLRDIAIETLRGPASLDRIMHYHGWGVHLEQLGMNRITFQFLCSFVEALNDCQKLTFPEIADLMEQVLPKLSTWKADGREPIQSVVGGSGI